MTFNLSHEFEAYTRLYFVRFLVKSLFDIIQVLNKPPSFRRTILDHIIAYQYCERASFPWDEIHHGEAKLILCRS